MKSNFLSLIQKNTFLGLEKQERDKFYNSKFDYYKSFNNCVLFISVTSSLAYFISDCQLFGRFAIETLVPRFSILIIYLLYLLFIKKFKNYFMNILASQFVGHSIMWCTIWAIYYLPNKRYASVGFTIMQIVILMLGFASTFGVASLSQLLIIFNILVSNTFNNYEDLNLMLSLGIPCSVGIALASFVFTQSYYETYKVTNKLKKLSFVDQLTGAYNRHKLEEISINNKLNDFDKPVSFAILDIDFFKKINDTYGHDMGDIVLRSLVDIVKEYLNDKSYIIRWGGEEFVLVLYNYDEYSAYNLVDSIRKHVENMVIDTCRITISAGVVDYTSSNYNDTINKADKALYLAKNTGRNRVIRYSTC